MNKCVFCKKENDLFSLKMIHMEEDLGPGIVYKVCGTCWETIAEIALQAYDRRLSELMNVIELAGSAKERSSERSFLKSKYIFEAYLEIIKGFSGEVKTGLDGRKYVWMHDIRVAANNKLAAINLEESPQSVSHWIRNILQLEVGRRQGRGVPVFIDEEKIVELAQHFGLQVSEC